MLDQLFDIVKQYAQNSIANNSNIPREQHQEVMAEATNTIASGFQNIVAGGGLESILDLFKQGNNGNSGNNGSNSSGLAGLVKNPIVAMMMGHFISKLVSKYNMSSSSASKVANDVIPNALHDVIQQTNDPNNEKATLDSFVGSMVGNAGVEQQATAGNNSSPLQDLLDQFTGNGGGQTGSGQFNLQSLVQQFTQKAQDGMQNPQQNGGGGLIDLIKGFM